MSEGVYPSAPCEAWVGASALSLLEARAIKLGRRRRRGGLMTSFSWNARAVSTMIPSKLPTGGPLLAAR